MEIFKKKTPEELSEKSEAFIKKLNETAPLFVPYEVFKQAMEINGENMKEIYSMMHSINMEKMYTIEMNAGDFGFIISGPSCESEMIVKTAKDLTDSILGKVFSKNAMKMLVKKPVEKQERPDERDKNYA